VETRISILKDERDNDESVQYNEEIYKDDYQDQISHWEAILAEINEAIENNRLEFELDNPED